MPEITEATVQQILITLHCLEPFNEIFLYKHFTEMVNK